jgi:uncharacterized protein (DUF58 family)
MMQSRFTIYAKTVLFLSFLLFFVGYLFVNLLPALFGTFLLLFLVYTKQSFKQSIGEIAVQRTIIEQLRFVNHPVHVKTILKNKGGILIINARDVLPETTTLLRGEHSTHKLVKPGEEIVLDYQIAFSSRGTHRFETIEIECTDRWNLYTRQSPQTQITEIMVHSDPEEIKKAKRISTREHIEVTLPSFIGVETSSEMEGIREYIPGDQLRDIEWKATSRLQKMMTKLYQKKQTVETIILMDCSRSMRRTRGKSSKLEHATVLALQLTKILQSLRHTVGLIAYDEFKTLQSIDPSYKYTHIFEELARLPSTIQMSEYIPKGIPESPLVQKEDVRDRQRFLSTVFPFLARGRRTIQSQTQASGIYEAIRILFRDSKSKHVIILTDMETNLQSLYTSLSLAHVRKYTIWVLAFFSPAYYLDQQHLTVKELEQVYALQNSLEKIALKFKKQNIELIEVSPQVEGGTVIETIRRNKR